LASLSPGRRYGDFNPSAEAEVVEAVPIGRRARFPACRFTGLSSPVCVGTGNWKVALTGRLESLPYD